MGFRGAGALSMSGGTSGGTSTDYVNVSTNNFHGNKGEGIAGTPRYVYDAATDTVVNTGAEGYRMDLPHAALPVTQAAVESDTDLAANQRELGAAGGGGNLGRRWSGRKDLANKPGSGRVWRRSSLPTPQPTGLIMGHGRWRFRYAQ